MSVSMNAEQLEVHIAMLRIMMASHGRVTDPCFPAFTTRSLYLSGSDVLPGPLGPDGPVSPAVPAVPADPDGSPGPTDPICLFGPAGPTGLIDPLGPAGPTGPTYLHGPTGPPGSDGVDGRDGDTGPAGPVGLPGPAGPVGPTAVLPSPLRSARDYYSHFGIVNLHDLESLDAAFDEDFLAGCRRWLSGYMLFPTAYHDFVSLMKRHGVIIELSHDSPNRFRNATLPIGLRINFALGSFMMSNPSRLAMEAIYYNTWLDILCFRGLQDRI